METIMAHNQPTIGGIDKWEVEEAARTLERAQEIVAVEKMKKAALKVLKKNKKAVTKAITWADGL